MPDSAAGASRSRCSLYFSVVLLGTAFTCFQVAVTNLVGALGPAEQRTRNYSILSLGFAAAIFLVRMVIPALARRYSESQLITGAIFVAGGAYLMFPLFQDPWLLALASAVLGCGVGCGQPLSLTLIYNLAPQGRGGEAAGVRVSVNHMTHVAVPISFGTVAAAVGLAPLFIASAALMMACGVVAQRRFVR